MQFVFLSFNLWLPFASEQETFQDPSAIDIESEDFKALPAEIQHELIKEIKAERKWISKNYIPRVWRTFRIKNILKIRLFLWCLIVLHNFLLCKGVRLNFQHSFCLVICVFFSGSLTMGFVSPAHLAIKLRLGNSGTFYYSQTYPHGNLYNKDKSILRTVYLVRKIPKFILTLLL